MHALEKRSLHDPFLADALEGADYISAVEFSADVQELDGKISKKKNNNWIWPLRIAASLIFVAGSYWTVNQLTQQAKPETLALKKDSKEEQPLSQKLNDSALADTSTPSNKSSPKEFVTRPEATSQPNLAAGSQSKSAIAKEEKPLALLDNTLTEAANQEKGDVSKAEPLEKPTAQEAERSISRVEARAKRMSSAGVGAEQKVVSGKVVAAEDGSPIPGVNVAVSGTAQGTVTDEEGNYQLTTEGNNPELLFSFIGFKTKKLVAREKNELVKLEQDISQLSEVVIVGRAHPEAVDTSPVIKSAEPVGGIKAYDAYLENNLRYPTAALAKKVKGKVALKFTVRTDGQLDEFKIVKSLGDDCDKEMLRLVKDGPPWIPGTVDNLPVENEVLVRLIFDPAKAKK
jgi:TonB family protein